jgi:hypothetical protein
LALCLAASLAAAWLQPPETKNIAEGETNTQSAPSSVLSAVGPAKAEALPEEEIRNLPRRSQAKAGPQSTTSPEADSAALLNRIKELSPLLLQLRRGDQYGEWLQIQRQWQALATLKHQDHLAAQKAKTEVVPRSLRDDGGFSQETLDKTIRALNLF